MLHRINQEYTLYQCVECNNPAVEKTWDEGTEISECSVCGCIVEKYMVDREGVLGMRKQGEEQLDENDDPEGLAWFRELCEQWDKHDRGEGTENIFEEE